MLTGRPAVTIDDIAVFAKALGVPADAAHARNRSFATSAADPETKNAILLQATHSIFSPQVTGYAAPEKDAPGMGQVMELYRGVASVSKER